MHGIEKNNKNSCLFHYLLAILLTIYALAQMLVFTPQALADTPSPSNSTHATQIEEDTDTGETRAELKATPDVTVPDVESPVQSGKEPSTIATPKTETAPDDASAQNTEPETIKHVNTVLTTSIEHSISVKLDGQDLTSGLVHRSDEDGLYFDPLPIFEALENSYVYNADDNLFTFQRSQDNAKFAIHMISGVVTANGRPVGKLPHFGEISENRILLTANALSFLTGTSASYDKETRTFDFKLDPRLKIATGFDIFVEDVPLQDLNPAPRSVGSVLILPLLPIAEALGHDVTIIDGGTTIRIRRAQDSAVFMLNLDTGLVSLRERPFGLVQDVALIDRTNLLLPTNAIETLTGTHVNVVTGTNRINILLDDELKGGAVPVARVDDLLKDTPFTPEALDFVISPDRVNRVNFTFHKGRYNGRLRYEVQDLPTEVAELEPSWLSLDFRHTSGIYGSVGDYSGDLRELDGVNIRRIRGVSVVKETNNGNRWALTAGVPEDGRRQISDDQTRSSFSGLAAGARFASRQGWEAGVAVHHDSLNDDQRAVLSAISGSLGRDNGRRLQWSARGDVGVFNGETRQRTVDASAAVSGRYKYNKTVSIDAGIEYQGVEFQRNILNDRADDELAAQLDAELSGIETQDVVENPVEDNQIAGQDILTQSVGLNITPQLNNNIIRNPSLALRYSRTDNGLTSGQDTGTVVQTSSISLGTNIGDTGVSIGGGIIDNRVSFNSNQTDLQTRQYTVLASKSFDWVDLRGQYQKNTGTTTSSNVDQLVVTANFNTNRNFNLELPKEGHFTVSPTISAGQFNGQNRIRGGAIANLDTGNIFGKKNQVQASFGLLQSINNFNDGETSKFLTVTAAREINFGKNLSLGLSYRNNLNGNQRIGLELRGGYRFNEPRRYTKTQAGRGVLKGQAFLDKNYDGIRQPDEPGAGGVILRIQRSGLALRSDSQGFFTIQNIKEGLHTIAVDSRSLPLGFGLPDNEDFKATIREGHISNLDIPIVQRGQLRGFTFIDANNDGEYNQGEKRVEDVRLTLVNEDLDVDESAVSTSFGQFAFDDLRPDRYKIIVSAKGGPGYKGGNSLTVELNAASFDLKKIAIPLAPLDPEILTAEKKDGLEPDEPPPQQVTRSATP